MLSREYYAYLEDARRKQDSLKHYGTPGQKWGVRHWQYADGRFNPEGKERYFGSKTKENDGQDANPEIGISYLEAKLLLYLSATAVTVAGYGVAAGVSAVHDAKVSKNIKKYEEHRSTEEIDKKTGLKLKSNPDATTEEDMKDINMEHRYWMFHGNEREGCTQNCMLCTTAMDLKRRGYDVKAGKVKNGFPTEELKKWYKNAEPKTNRIEQIIKELKQEPEGSYGNFMCTWQFGGGHSMFYRIENGKIAIYDAQSGKYYKDFEKSNLYKNAWGGNGGTSYLRTDNLEININYLKENDYIR